LWFLTDKQRANDNFGLPHAVLIIVVDAAPCFVGGFPFANWLNQHQSEATS
jgi:hypothetical protein